MVRTPHFHGQGCGFNPWSGNWDPASHALQPKKKKNRKPIGARSASQASSSLWSHGRILEERTVQVGGVAAGPKSWLDPTTF